MWTVCRCNSERLANFHPKTPNDQTTNDERQRTTNNERRTTTTNNNDDDDDERHRSSVDSSFAVDFSGVLCVGALCGLVCPKIMVSLSEERVVARLSRGATYLR